MPKQNYDDDDDDLLMALQSLEPCGNCGADGAKIPCMSGCGSIFYCSRECGMHHASAHRLRCRNLRCSKFNDSDSESGSDSGEEFSDDSDEYETDSDEEEESEEEEEVKPKKQSGGKKGKGKGKGKRKLTRTESAGGGGGGSGGNVMVDSEVERRIEEKIMRRLKKQEENRIAQAIEQRMREEKANWRDDEMNRIIMEMRERMQKEFAGSDFMSQFVKKNGHTLESQNSSDMLNAFQAAMASSGAGGAQDANPQAEGKEAGAPAGASQDDARGRGMSKESSWNNACREFEALRVVVWKHSFLPSMVFVKNTQSGIWNAIQEMDGDESFSHIAVGDALISVNGREVDASVQTEEDLQDIFAAFASPLILKFEAADPYNDKVHDYTVTWSNGPLGVTLKDDCSNQKVPIVNRLTKKSGSVAVKHNIAIGDVLVAINNIDTIQLGCSLSMSILKKVQLPAKLKFRGVGGPPGGVGGGDEECEMRKTGETPLSATLARPPTYIVNWGEGPLGLTIIPGMDEDDLPVIKKVTGTGTSEGIESAQIGDFLESMNDIPTTGMAFDDVVAYLKSAPKPVMLRFRSATSEEGEPAAIAAPQPMPVLEITRAVSNQSSTSSTASAPAVRASPSPSPSPSPPKVKSAPAMVVPPAPVPAPVPRRQSQVVHDEMRDNYKVVWGDGPLGLTIDAREDSPTGAYIKRIASTGAASRLSQDCIGDFLTHINDMDVARIAFLDIVTNLKNAPRPVTLFFKRRTDGLEKRGFAQSSSSVPTSYSAAAAHQQRGRMSDTPTRGRQPSATEEAGIHYYNVVWQDGTPLGLSLRGGDNSSDYPYITRVTGNGSAAHLPTSVVGDCLVSVDGRSVHVRDKTFDEVMAMLKNMPKPVTLKFQARTDDQPRGGSSSSMNAPSPMDQHSGSHIRHNPHQLQQQSSQSWRQQSSGPPQYQQQQQQQQQHPPQYQQQPPYRQPPQASYGQQHSSSSLPSPGTLFQSSLVHQNSNLSRSYVTPNGTALDASSGNEDKFANIQSPFLVQNKLSTGRRQKMLKGLKK